MKKIILLALVAFNSTTAIAGSAFGTVEQVELGPGYGSKVFIRVAGDVTGQPTCQNNSFHFAFDASEPGGNGVLSTVLAAKASGQKVRISGYAQCTRYNSVEDLRWIRLE